MDAARAPVSLHEKLEFLSHPAAYPEGPACVELRETHLSYVFLTPNSAYKMKKRVAQGVQRDRVLTRESSAQFLVMPAGRKQRRIPGIKSALT